MDFFNNLGMGFSVALIPMNLVYCFIGCCVGTFIGVLPGIGPTATIALLLPITFYLDYTSAVIMLAGIYYGAMYGGSTTSILVNMPGEAASVVTTLDGYQMALQGRAGPALGISALASFIAGTVSIVFLGMAAPPLADMALRFGPPEYFGVVFCGVVLLIYLAGGSMLKGAIMAICGFFLGSIGSDFITGQSRFTFGSLTLENGIGMVPAVMGLFGIGEVLDNIDKSLKRNIFKAHISHILPNLQDWKNSAGSIIRGTFLGVFLGILPGGGATVSSFASYTLEKRISKHPEKFGKGVIEGVAGPEAANNSATGGAFIPLMTLGIPANPVMAVIMGALIIHGIQPGPLLLTQHGDLFWGVVASMYIGNVMLLILNLPLIPMWVKLLRVPYTILFPIIILLCMIGSYSLNSNYWEVIIMVIFGIFGYFMRKFEYEPAPLVFALILSELIENTLRQSLLMSHGSFSIFFTRPISLGFMIVAISLLAFPIFSLFKRKLIRA